MILEARFTIEGDVVPESRTRRERSENANIAKQDDIN